MEHITAVNHCLISKIILDKEINSPNCRELKYPHCELECIILDEALLYVSCVLNHAQLRPSQKCSLNLIRLDVSRDVT